MIFSFKEMEIRRYKKRTEYRLDGNLHREDGPAIEYTNGDKSYYFNGKLHREDGPAIEYTNGFKIYLIHGNRHRVDGPAIEFSNGSKEYYIDGKRHRIGGPAVIEHSHAEIWIDGVKISETEEYYTPIKSAKK